MDSLSQILTQANVQANSKLLLVDGCNGLVLAALMEKMAGNRLVMLTIPDISMYSVFQSLYFWLCFVGFGTIIDFYAQDSMVR